MAVVSDEIAFDDRKKAMFLFTYGQLPQEEKEKVLYDYAALLIAIPSLQMDSKELESAGFTYDSSNEESVSLAGLFRFLCPLFSEEQLGIIEEDAKNPYLQSEASAELCIRRNRTELAEPVQEEPAHAAECEIPAEQTAQPLPYALPPQTASIEEIRSVAQAIAAHIDSIGEEEKRKIAAYYLDYVTTARANNADEQRVLELYDIIGPKIFTLENNMEIAMFSVSALGAKVHTEVVVPMLAAMESAASEDYSVLRSYYIALYSNMIEERLEKPFGLGAAITDSERARAVLISNYFNEQEREKSSEGYFNMLHSFEEPDMHEDLLEYGRKVSMRRRLLASYDSLGHVLLTERQNSVLAESARSFIIRQAARAFVKKEEAQPQPATEEEDGVAALSIAAQEADRKKLQMLSPLEQAEEELERALAFIGTKPSAEVLTKRVRRQLQVAYTIFDKLVRLNEEDAEQFRTAIDRKLYSLVPAIRQSLEHRFEFDESERAMFAFVWQHITSEERKEMRTLYFNRIIELSSETDLSRKYGTRRRFEKRALDPNNLYAFLGPRCFDFRENVILSVAAASEEVRRTADRLVHSELETMRRRSERSYRKMLEFKRGLEVIYKKPLAVVSQTTRPAQPAEPLLSTIDENVDKAPQAEVPTVKCTNPKCCAESEPSLFCERCGALMPEPASGKEHDAYTERKQGYVARIAQQPPEKLSQVFNMLLHSASLSSAQQAQDSAVAVMADVLEQTDGERQGAALSAIISLFLHGLDNENVGEKTEQLLALWSRCPAEQRTTFRRVLVEFFKGCEGTHAETELYKKMKIEVLSESDNDELNRETNGSIKKEAAVVLLERTRLCEVAEEFGITSAKLEQLYLEFMVSCTSGKSKDIIQQAEFLLVIDEAPALLRLAYYTAELRKLPKEERAGSTLVPKYRECIQQLISCLDSDGGFESFTGSRDTIRKIVARLPRW